MGLRFGAHFQTSKAAATGLLDAVRRLQQSVGRGSRARATGHGGNCPLTFVLSGILLAIRIALDAAIRAARFVCGWNASQITGLGVLSSERPEDLIPIPVDPRERIPAGATNGPCLVERICAHS